MKKLILTTVFAITFFIGRAQSPAVAKSDSLKKAETQQALDKKRHHTLDSLAKAYNTRKSQAGAPAQGQSQPTSTTTKATAAASSLGKLYDLLPGRTRTNTTPAAGSTTSATTGSASTIAGGGNLAIKNIDNGIGFTVTGCVGNSHDQTVTVYFTFSNPAKVHQMISLAFKSYNVKTNALDNESNTFDANLISLAGDNTTSVYGTFSKQLPTGNSMKGAVTFGNVLTSVKQFSLVNIIAASCNWNGGGDKKSGLIEIKNVPIVWDAQN